MNEPIAKSHPHHTHTNALAPTPIRRAGDGVAPGAFAAITDIAHARRSTDIACTKDILVIDDDRAVGDALAASLRDEGYTAEVASDGGEGLACLRARQYRALVLDLAAPPDGGAAVLRALQDAPALRPPAVIVVAGPRARFDTLAALDAGADDYLAEPFDPADLALRVDLWLRRITRTPPARRAGLRVHSLGRFRVEGAGETRLHPGGRARKANALFKYLLTHQERTVSADELFALLWPHITQDVAAMDLRSLLYQLRKLLGARAHGPAYLEHTGATLALRLGPDDWWDVAEFAARLDEGVRWRRAGATQQALVAYAEGVALYAGDYLAEDAYADWARPLREQLREDWLRALEAMAKLHGEREDHGRQEHDLRTVLRADPYRERSQRALMTLLARQGRSAEALVLYRQLARLLRVELEADPDPETQAVAAHIRHSSHSSACAVSAP